MTVETSVRRRIHAMKNKRHACPAEIRVKNAFFCIGDGLCQEGYAIAGIAFRKPFEAFTAVRRDAAHTV